MPRTIAVSACQMDAAYAPLSSRLERAAALIDQAASDGADLVVLPELFNTGYGYEAELVRAAEHVEGRSVDFLVDRAQQHGILVAGSLLVRDGDDVFNALVLAGRDGRTWRYDKVHPWAWERSVFAGSRQRTVVADTELGRIGMLVCWDTAHPQLWAEYAGRVQLVVVASCPINATAMRYRMADGTDLRARDVPGASAVAGAEHLVFSEMIPEQAAWLGVPVVNAGVCGRFATPLPRGAVMAAIGALRSPRRWASVLSRSPVELHGDPTPATRIEDAARRVSARLDLSAGESYVTTEVVLAATPPRPTRAQPRTRLPKVAYLLSDTIVPRLMETPYQANLRRASGGQPSRKLADRLRAVLRPLRRGWSG